MGTASLRWLCALAGLFIAGSALAADVRVMISAGFYRVYAELAPGFEKSSGHRLITTRGPSMGDSPESIPARLARGEAADVVIMDGEAAEGLVKRGMARADGKVELARSQVGMVVRAGAAKPDIGSVDALRRVLLEAKSIAYSDSGSGTYLSNTLFAKLGVAEQVAGKSRRVRGPPSGEPVAAVVARGEVEIGFQQVSELIHVPGVTFVGALPAELQPGFSFAGALTAKSEQPEAARALLRFLSAPAAAPVITKAGLEPLSSLDPRVPASEPLKVLFVGNSLTYWNDLPAMVAAMGNSADSPRRIQTRGLTRPRATLEQLWRTASGERVIREGKWDVVVLQERGTWPLRDPENMYAYARLFNAEIRKSGARTIFFLTWAPLDREEMQPVVDRIYYTIAKELNARVAPVGPAWELARKLDPKINLYNGDQYSHPTVAGSYLSACVVYLVMMDQRSCPAIEPRFDIQPEEIAVARSAASQAALGVR